jgi:hypothetical protein
MNSLKIDFNETKLFTPNNKYRVFHKDIITYNIHDNNITDLNIIETNSNDILLSGIIDLIDKTIYGFSKSGKSYKLFRPLNKVFPDFLVPYQLDTKRNENMFILIKFSKWDNKNKYPIGEIVNIFGFININMKSDEILNIYETCLTYWDGFKDKQIKKIKFNYNSDKINKLNELFNSISPYHNIPNRFFKLMCNIDPLGCTDIDDVISYCEFNNKNYIGIHITDVIYVLNLFKNEFPDLINKNRFSTVYSYSNQYNILPDKIIDDYLTLKPSVKRYVWSIYINITELNTDTLDYAIIPEIIMNKNSYTYNDKIPNMSNIAEFCYLHGKKNYPNIFSMYENHLNNNHYIITLLMTITNHLLGNYLISNDKMIYRTTYDLNTSVNATYTFNNETNKHHTLNIKNYTHFTSPIRRFIDQYVQNELYLKKFNIKLFEFDTINNDFLNNINESLIETKFINNKFKLLRLIGMYDNKMIRDCKLIEIKYMYNKIYLKWVISFNDEFIKITDMINNELITKINNEEINIKNLLTNDSINLRINYDYNLIIKFMIMNNFTKPKIIIDYSNI